MLSTSKGGIGVSGNGGHLAGFFDGDVEVTGGMPLTNADCAEEFDMAETTTIDTAKIHARSEGKNTMNARQVIVSILIAGSFIVAGMILPSVGQVQDTKVKTAMELLRSMADKLGRPKIEGADSVVGKQVPAIYFGSTKINNNFDLVDEVAKQAGGTATIFVKNGEDYVRVATNVKKDDGSRAIGTILDPKGKAFASIQKNDAFYGDVEILGKPYTAGYEPIRDTSKNVIGIYYVGYMK